MYTMWEVVLKTLSVYFVFDVEYPATFGILAVIDKFCLTTDEEEELFSSQTSERKKTTKKRKTTKKMFQCL